MKILSFGEIIWDIYTDKSYIGGAPLNFATHIAKLGIQSYLMSSVGNDKLGYKAINYLNKNNIKTDFITKSHNSTGKCIVSLDENKIPTYKVLENSAYDNIVQNKAAYNINFDAFYFGTLSQRTKCNRKTLYSILKQIKTKEIFCDINIRFPFYSDEIINLCFLHSSIIKISREELPVIINSLNFNKNLNYNQFAHKIHSKFSNIKIIIITLDKDGAYIFNCTDETDYEQKALNTKVVSTVGAGDSFSAAFLFKYLQNNPINVCLQFAIQLSSFVVSKAAAIPEYNESILQNIIKN